MKTSIMLSTFAVAISMGALAACPAAAQEGRPAPVAEFAAGTLLFPDDGELVREGFVGGAVRFHVSPRLSVGPEIAYVQGGNHSHLVLTGNMTFDFIGPAAGREPAVTPFVTAGGGVFSSRGPTFSLGTVIQNEGAFTAGGGVRVRVGDRVYVGGEARLGWETHLRLNALVSVRLGK
jgi:hypothetical protein